VLGEHASDPGDGEGAHRVREPRQHLDAGEVGVDLRLHARATIGVGAGHDLGAHGVCHHLLHDAADHHQQLGQHVEPLGRGKTDPAARRTGQHDERRGNQARTDEGVGAALGAQDRHGVDELAHHHLGGPRQLQPHGERGELGRREGQRLLHPEAVGDGDQPERARGEVDRQQRQVGGAEGPDRRQQRRLQAVAHERRDTQRRRPPQRPVDRGLPLRHELAPALTPC
jgi:hypothetical protein